MFSLQPPIRVKNSSKKVATSIKFSAAKRFRATVEGETQNNCNESYLLDQHFWDIYCVHLPNSEILSPSLYDNQKAYHTQIFKSVFLCSYDYIKDLNTPKFK